MACLGTSRPPRQQGPRAFFECPRFFGRGRFRILMGVVSGSTSRSQSLPAPLWRDRLEAQFASHPACHLAARPQTAIRRRLVKAHAQSRQKIGFQDRCRCAVAAAQIAESLGSFGIRQAIVRSIVRQTPSPPILARWCDHAPVARSSGSAASPWHPEIQHTVLPAPPRSNARTVAVRPNPPARPLSLSASQAPVNLLSQRRVNRPETV